LCATAVADGAIKDWNRVALRLPGRTNKDCRKRFGKISRDLKKGAWYDWTFLLSQLVAWADTTSLAGMPQKMLG
jgi:hypothetical protein